MVFNGCVYINREKTILVIRQLTGVFSWWKLLADCIPKGEVRKMFWEKFLEELNRKYCTEQDLLEINNEFQNLKKGKMSVSEYDATFTKKIKLVHSLVATKLSNVNTFSMGLPVDFGPMVKLATTLKGKN